MSKLALCAAALSTATASTTFLTSTGGSVIGEGGGGNVTVSPSTPTLSVSGETIEDASWEGFIPKLSSVKDIETKYKDIECLKGRIEDIKNWDTKTSDDSGISDDINFSPQSRSCLIVDYYKKTYTNDKWSGEFKLIWSVEDGQHRFLTVVQAKTGDAKLIVDSSIYTIRGSEDQTLSVNYAKSVKEEVDSKSSLSLIPKSGTLIEDKYTDSNKYWGFNPDLSKICGKQECKSLKETPSKSSVIWESSHSSDGNSILYSFDNFDRWLQDKFNWSSEMAGLLTNSIENIKSRLTIRTKS